MRTPKPYLRGRVYWGGYTDAEGVRRVRSLQTDNYAVAVKVLADLVNRENMIRLGLATRESASHAEAHRKPLRRHIDDYLAWLDTTGRSKSWRGGAALHLRAVAAETGAGRIQDLTPERIAANLAAYQASGKGAKSGAKRNRARSVNYRRSHLVGFFTWARQTQRTTADPMPAIPVRDEARDRWRIRRALEDHEIAALLAHADTKGRGLWYRFGLFAGLRRGEIVRIRWADIDLEAGTIRIVGGKTKGEAVIPLHAEIASRLRAVRPMMTPGASPRVFPTAVTTRTQRSDFLAAGIARMEPVVDDKGREVRDDAGRFLRRYTTADEAGHEADLHSLRHTFVTRLARAGAPIQVVQRLARHASISVTVRVYTRLGLRDERGALSMLSVPTLAQEVAATGTDETPATVAQLSQNPGDSSLSGATRCNADRDASGIEASEPEGASESQAHEDQGPISFQAYIEGNGRGGNRTHDIPRVKRTL